MVSAKRLHWKLLREVRISHFTVSDPGSGARPLFSRQLIYCDMPIFRGEKKFLYDRGAMKGLYVSLGLTLWAVR